MRKSAVHVCLIVFLLAAGTVRAQEYYRQLLDDATRDLLHEVLSGELAKEHVYAISRYHRVQGSREYRKAAEYVLSRLRGWGFPEQDAYIESFTSDGRTVYQTWQSPSGWDIDAAELRMLEPYEERIAGYPEIAMSLITYSNPGDVTAELVWVGEGTSDRDYRGKDVRGRFVLATGYGGEVHRYAVLKYGARAVVCYLDDERAMEYPDMLAYTGMWPKTEELPRVTFGFNLTKRQGEKLRKLVESGRKVVMHGWVRGAGLEPYYMDIPVAHIRGSEKPDEELVFVGHLDHPKESANDNASGSAVMLDIARGLKELIDTGRMPRPKRSIRFLWVPEFYGTMAYIDKHEEVAGPAYGGTFLACINLDMVGENLEMIHTNMNFTRTPQSIPSALNDVVENMAQMVDRMDIRTPRGSLSRFNYRMTPYSGGSDHNVFIDRKIPAVMFGHGDYTHHTSEDTPEKVDPVELERAAIIGAGTMLYLANVSEAQAVDLVYLAGANAARALGLAARIDRESPLQCGNRIEHVFKWQAEAVSSILQFNDSERVSIAVHTMNAQLEAQRWLLPTTAETGGKNIYELLDPNPDIRIPVRLTRGPLASGYPKHITQPSVTGNAQFETVNFMDGNTSVSEIWLAVTAEYGPIPKENIVNFIEDMVREGLARWK